jgi:toxin ParE1/3/4
MIIWSVPALHSLRDIYAYIAADDPAAAKRLVNHTRTAVERLDGFPLMGRPGRRHGTRELIIDAYVVTYRVSGRNVYIVSVWHGAKLR